MRRYIPFVLIVAAAACSKKSGSNDPLVYAGGFQIPVPEEWHNVTPKELTEKGEVMLQTLKVGDRKDKPAVSIIFSALPEPVTKDPGTLADCKAHAASLTALTVESSNVIDLPVGKACAVEATKGPIRARQVVLKVGERGLMANCSHRGGDEENKLCDAVFQRIAVRM